MRSCCLSQVLLQCAVEYHLCVLERRVIDEPVHLGAHGQGGIQAVINAGRVDADGAAVGIAQLYTGCIDVELSGYQLSHFSPFSRPASKAGAYQNAYQNHVEI